MSDDTPVDAAAPAEENGDALQSPSDDQQNDQQPEHAQADQQPDDYTEKADDEESGENPLPDDSHEDAHDDTVVDVDVGDYDEEAPFGRDPDGRPYTKEEYDEWVNSGAALGYEANNAESVDAFFDEAPTAVDLDAPYGRESGTDRPYTKEEYDEWLQAAGYNPDDYEDPATAASNEHLNAYGEDQQDDGDGGDVTSPDADADDLGGTMSSTGSADFTAAAAYAAANSAPPPVPSGKTGPPPPPGPAPEWAKKKKKMAEEEIATTKYYIKQALEQENHALLSELVQRAHTLHVSPQDELLKRAEEVVKKMNSNAAKTEGETVAFYLKHAMELKNREALKTAVAKAAKIPEHLRPDSVGSDGKENFEQLLSEAKSTLHNMDKAEAETVKFYLNQGLQLRNRDVLHASMSKTNSLPKGLLNPELIDEASKLLERLDSEHLIHQFLTSAIKQKDLEGLQAALNKALALRMSPQNDELVKKAQDLMAHLQKKKKKGMNRSLKAFFGSKPKEEEKAVLFGSSLAFAMQQGKYIVPDVVFYTVEFLRKEALLKEGLFRVPGDKETMHHMREMYNKGKKVELSSVDDAAGVLKQYLRMLPEPLVPFALYRRFIDLTAKYKADSKEMTVALHNLMKEIPADHLNCLNYLVRFLADLAKHTAQNKMDSNNLAIVFAPNILKPQHETAQGMLTEMPKTIALMKAIIDRADDILPPLPESLLKSTTQ